MAEFIYTMISARKKVGDKVILDDVTMSFYPGAKIGVVGPNGSGKSTILKIMAGLDEPSNGEARLSPGYSVGILMQEPALNEDKTVLGNVQEGVGEIYEKLQRFNQISEEMANPDADFDALMAEMGTLQEAIDAANAWDLDSQLEQAMDALRCPPPEADVSILSGGERRRVALCKLLLSKPDLLLLDEPTNHLDAESVLWLEQHLAAYEGAVLAVTHDRYFLDHVAQWICEVDRGRLYPYEGNYSTYLEKKQARLKVQGKKDVKMAKRLSEELDWVRSNAKGRQTKSKARLNRYEEMAAEAERTKKLDMDEIQIPPGPRLGTQVIEAENLQKGFDDRQLIDGLSFSLPRNGIVGVIGPNGVGKSTLFKTIVGMEELDGGKLAVGDSVKLSYVDQSRAGIDSEKSLWEVVSDGLDFIHVGAVEMSSRAYVSAFGFKGPDQQKKAGVLSGGERNRLNLALTLKQGGNLLLLDEPTNDLDVETLGSLENALLDFPGCAVVISHDRWFLDRVATHILAWEGTDEKPADWYWFEGNFESYEQNKVERLGADAARPHRVTHRRLTRD
ncbi:energy-dependent translational throttle protein EttA [Nesterenkonia sp. LB17]|uniref:energy-dependent translational throttle protein EttA n=1 Tax=unclassified Nesterenkonia TaxID=2629769 RepID=UPI001F4CB074|nr:MULTISPECIES: energy-dependent translational throttle protein EttA [unclassified Nesterenkonia]MCH8562368.1 energy-dependent translational throttle protein EttA [Nesterenkonia sp. YGD6]MCH8565304.1 energy-dependent translational throttle protein EttA [Nesterenkonia sp. LB17]MCH8571222.1 energy-dependent translational throttle protein EttA [Nesterenkonia sp. AY15]